MTEITNERFKELIRREQKLLALEDGGVDNWEYYDFSLKEFFKTQEQNEKRIELLEELEVIFLLNAYEPSEQGAGYCATDEAREDAEALLIVYDMSK